MKSRPNPSRACIYLVSYFEYQKDVLFKLLAVILGIQIIKVLPNGWGLSFILAWTFVSISLLDLNGFVRQI